MIAFEQDTYWHYAISNASMMLAFVSSTNLAFEGDERASIVLE